MGLYGDITGEYMQDVTLTPRFDVSAKLAREMWKQRFAQQVDGVLAIDPVTLSYVLRATGPVQLPTGDTLTADNAVQMLLSDVYAKYPDPVVQDAFFASASSAVFDKVASGGFDTKAFVSALTQSADESRLRLWSADTAEQRRISGTPVAGELPTATADSSQFAVYLNDGTGSKMDYYLDKSVSVGSSVCRKDGRPTSVVEITLKNTAPADAATSLPRYVTGGGDFGVEGREDQDPARRVRTRGRDLPRCHEGRQDDGRADGNRRWAPRGPAADHARPRREPDLPRCLPRRGEVREGSGAGELDSRRPADRGQAPYVRL